MSTTAESFHRGTARARSARIVPRPLPVGRADREGPPEEPGLVPRRARLHPRTAPSNVTGKS